MDAFPTPRRQSLVWIVVVALLAMAVAGSALWLTRSSADGQPSQERQVIGGSALAGRNLGPATVVTHLWSSCHDLDEVH